jgi:hypothetical protein
MEVTFILVDIAKTCPEHDQDWRSVTITLTAEQLAKLNMLPTEFVFNTETVAQN